MKIFSYTILSTLIFISCNSSNEKSNLFGRYKTKHNKGEEYIELKSDSTYLHYFKRNTNEIRDSGKWRFELRKNESDHLILEDWKSYADFGDSLEIGNSPSTASFIFYNAQIHVYPDDDSYDFFKE